MSNTQKSRGFSGNVDMHFDQMKAQLDFRFNSKQYNSLNVVQDYTEMVFSMFFVLELNIYPNHPIKIISLRIIQ